MNIFVVDTDPIVAAKSLCDQHVVKMILESAQLLCSPFDKAPYKRTHYNHPCAKWVRRSQDNYSWLLQHAVALCAEYSYRYGKVHKSYEVIQWCADHRYELPIPIDGLTPFANAVADEFKHLRITEAYRQYYIKYKTFAKWTKRNPPEWYNANQT